MKRIIGALALLLSLQAMADTLPPGKVELKGGSDGTTIGNIGDSLKTTGTATVSGPVTVVQPTGTNLHSVIDNFPSTFGVTQITSPWVVSGSLGRTWSLLHTGDSVASWILDGSGNPIGSTSGALNAFVTNASLAVTGTFWQTTQPISGTVNVGNFPSSQNVVVTNTPTVTANAGTNLNTSALALEAGGHLQSIDGKLTSPLTTNATLQAGSAIVGKVGIDQTTPGTTNGVVVNSSALPTGAATNAGLTTINNTLGSPFQAGGSIGNTAFIANAGTNLNTSALALESGGHLASVDNKLTTTVSGLKVDGSAVTQPVSGTFWQSVQPVSQSGAWTTGRTWSLLNTTDSVNVGNFPASFGVTQSTSPWVVSGTVLVSNFPATFGVTQSTSPWVVSGTVTSNIGTTGGLALDSTLSALSAKFNSLGQKTMATSAPVVIASDQSAIPVSQSGAWTTGRTWSLINTSDSVNSVQSGTWTTGRTWSLSSGSDSVTAIQGTSPWVENVSQFGGSNVATGTGASGAGIPRVTVSNDSNVLATQSGSWTVTANAGTNLNTSALALDATLAKLTQTQGSTTSGQSGPLIQAAVTTNDPGYSNGQTSPITVNVRGGIRIVPTGMDNGQAPIRNDYSANNVTTAAYFQLVASTTSELHRLHIFDSSGQDFVLATGGAGSEVDQIQIPPGGWDSPVDLFIPSGTRLSIKSKSATASSGILLITGLK